MALKPIIHAQVYSDKKITILVNAATLPPPHQDFTQRSPAQASTFSSILATIGPYAAGPPRRKTIQFLPSALSQPFYDKQATPCFESTQNRISDIRLQ